MSPTLTNATLGTHSHRESVGPETPLLTRRAFSANFNSAKRICAAPKAQTGEKTRRTASQAGRRGFESRLPLQNQELTDWPDRYFVPVRQRVYPDREWPRVNFGISLRLPRGIGQAGEDRRPGRAAASSSSEPGRQPQPAIKTSRQAKGDPV